jgi:Ni/Fe-hydrogenase subunit HybB-like protein
MIEKAFKGGKTYWIFLGILLAVISIGVSAYLRQLSTGLSVTGMSRDVSWGLYIAQFTFFVGVAASAVTVVLPYYLHDYKAFGKITILGEFLSVAAVAMCFLFIFVDLGQPFRIMNVFLYPSPESPMFWDTVALSVYLCMNLVISWAVLASEYRGTPPPRWLRALIILSIPWAVSIHTVTAFLYSGLPGRQLWLSALTAARFLASAFSSGPALLILLCLLMRRTMRYDAGRDAIKSLAVIIAYAFSIHVFFTGLEFFTVLYSGIESHVAPLAHMYGMHDSGTGPALLMWISSSMAVTGLVLFLIPSTRNSMKCLPYAALAVLLSVIIEKGYVFITAGFVPSPLHELSGYTPAVVEILITAGIWGTGIFVLSLLIRVFVTVKKMAL